MLRLVLAALLFGLPALAQPASRNWAKAACEDDLDSCKESCTIADGTSLGSQGRLARCSQRCQEQSERCIFKRFQARRDANVPKPTPPPVAAPPVDPLPSRPSPTASAPPASTPAATPAVSKEDDVWSDIPPAPPPEAPTPAARPRTANDVWNDLSTTSTPRASAAPTTSATSSPATPPDASATPVAAPPHPEDSVDALLDSHDEEDGASGSSAQPSPSTSEKKLPPQKKDLSKWDPGALE